MAAPTGVDSTSGWTCVVDPVGGNGVAGLSDWPEIDPERFFGLTLLMSSFRKGADSGYAVGEW
jgi:hypothetical protein